MNMTSLLDYVIPDVPGCPEAIVLNKIRFAAREFFIRSRLWRHDMFTDIDVTLGTRVYALTPTNPAHESNIAGVLQAWYEGTKIWPRAYPDLVSSWPHFPTASGRPSYYWFDVDNQISIFPSPSAAVADALDVLAIQAPKIDSDYFPDQFFSSWVPWIAHGAIAALMEIPKKPYSDIEGSLYHRAQFDRGVTQALGVVNSGGTVGVDEEINTLIG